MTDLQARKIGKDIFSRFYSPYLMTHLFKLPKKVLETVLVRLEAQLSSVHKHTDIKKALSHGAHEFHGTSDFSARDGLEALMRSTMPFPWNQGSTVRILLSGMSIY
jgi:hypothetical protein